MKRFSRVTRHFLFLMLFLLPIVLYGSPPDWVIRIDTREPELIFRDGFVAWGNDDNLANHVSGGTIENRTSAFVATADELVQDRVLREAFQLGLAHTIFVYRIRPTNNFYSVNNAAEAAASFSTSTRTRVAARAILHFYEENREWAALRTILPEQIASATRYTYDAEHGHIVTGETIRNVNYRSGAPHPNAGIYPLSGVNDTPLIDRIYIQARRYLSSIPLAFCMAGSARAPRGHSAIAMKYASAEDEKDWCGEPSIETFEQYMVRILIPFIGFSLD